MSDVPTAQPGYQQLNALEHAAGMHLHTHMARMQCMTLLLSPAGTSIAGIHPDLCALIPGPSGRGWCIHPRTDLQVLGPLWPYGPSRLRPASSRQAGR